MECLPHNPCKPPPPSTGLYSYARHSCTLGSPGLSLLLDYTSAWHSRPTVVKPLEIGMHVFWTWAPFFLDLYMLFGPNQNFFGPRVTKNVGDLLVCFLDPVGIFFGPACICAGPRDFFFNSQINCF